MGSLLGMCGGPCVVAHEMIPISFNICSRSILGGLSPSEGHSRRNTTDFPDSTFSGAGAAISLSHSHGLGRTANCISVGWSKRIKGPALVKLCRRCPRCPLVPWLDVPTFQNPILSGRHSMKFKMTSSNNCMSRDLLDLQCTVESAPGPWQNHQKGEQGHIVDGLKVFHPGVSDLHTH
jgi:hypothetical protein